MSDDMTMTPAALQALVKATQSGKVEDFSNFMAAATPGGIEKQEAQGQKDLVNSTNLPHAMGKAREVLEEWGFEFGERVDDLFLEAKLPDGWQKVATSHSMWSNIQDPQGRTRAAIFYKAAFYDRSAHLRLKRRFSVQQNYDRKDSENVLIYEVKNGFGEVLFATEPVDLTGVSADDHFMKIDPAAREKATAAREKATAWLTDNYPNWEDDIAQWED